MTTETNFGLSLESVLALSDSKHEPRWMREIRARAWDFFAQADMPKCIPEPEALPLKALRAYLPAQGKIQKDWRDIDAARANSFSELRKTTNPINGGVSAQFNSEMILHKTEDAVSDLGVVYMSLDQAIQDKNYSELIRKYFMSLIDIDEHKFTALHTAFWSGGSFIYVPPNTKLNLDLQAYCRFEEAGAGQFGHTIVVAGDGSDISFVESCSAPKLGSQSIHAAIVELFVGKNAKVKYTAIENWPDQVYNLNTKRAIIEDGGHLEFCTSMLNSGVNVGFPSIYLKGENSSLNFEGVSFVDSRQEHNAGVKVFLEGNHASSQIKSKSVAQNGGISTFHSYVSCNTDANQTMSYLDCDSLLLDNESEIDSIPEYQVLNHSAEIIHEAKVGKIDQAKLDYLITRGISEDKARALIVSGFTSSLSCVVPKSFLKDTKRITLQKTGVKND